jgi:lipopolysaccharide biosynthesis regulator YciM
LHFVRTGSSRSGDSRPQSLNTTAVRTTAFSAARTFLDRGLVDRALEELDRAPVAGRKRDGTLREMRLECCVALRRWEEGAALADALLHDGVKIPAVARFHCAYARHRLDAGDRSRALWEIAIALQTDEAGRAAVLADDRLRRLVRG